MAIIGHVDEQNCRVCPLNNTQIGLDDCNCTASSAAEQTADHILASLSLCHPPKEILGLAALVDDTVDWH